MPLECLKAQLFWNTDDDTVGVLSTASGRVLAHGLTIDQAAELYPGITIRARV